MSFMKHTVYRGGYYLVETSCGTELVPADVAGDLGLVPGNHMTSDDEPSLWAPMLAAVRDYVEGNDVNEIAYAEGWYGRLSAPGYMDATDWHWGDTEEEVRAELANAYGDDD